MCTHTHTHTHTCTRPRCLSTGSLAESRTLTPRRGCWVPSPASPIPQPRPLPLLAPLVLAFCLWGLTVSLLVRCQNLGAPANSAPSEKQCTGPASTVAGERPASCRAWSALDACPRVSPVCDVGPSACPACASAVMFLCCPEACVAPRGLW